MALREEDGKEFPLAGVLTIVTGYSLQESGISNVYDICNYMTGESLYTHALIRVRKEIKPYIIDWYPELDYSDDQMEAGCKKYGGWLEFLRALENLHGKTRILWPIPMDDHDVIDPMQELIDLRGGNEENIIIVDISDESDDISPYGDISFSQGSE